ncbi:hypothetical protein NDR87_30060 [Nocardia sp. CDC159]|uniref:Uncharacterized protein n=1 Tax=Nocardia pulmonis TaxID=2951408 RepID=A0A9X2EBM1_9NOCA|nr:MULTISPECIES: hypothetical protein [Nocardia]MCM6777737.1 hypothetical protein [Nocardia pulmonis]MCM6790622.1 hypothetical protein [Nocardia sp. CDC159]
MSSDEVYIRPFADFLAELRKGVVHSEVSQALHDLIAAVRDTGKSGSVSLTIHVSRHPKTDMLLIDDRVAVKLPAVERDSSLWFVDSHGNPSRRDPTQLELPGTNVHVISRKAENA